MKIDCSLTDISTCSCSTCTCSNEYLEANYDYLTYIFIMVYESAIWCMQMIYELFFKSFCQIKDELKYRRSNNKTSEELSKYHWSLRRNCRNTKEKDDSRIVVIPVRSSYCQTEPLCEISSRQNQTSFCSNVSSSSKKIHPHPHPRSSTKLSTTESSFANNSPPFFFKQKRRRMVDDHRIPLTLATSLHSNVSLDNVDYFITKYIRQLFTDAYHLH